MNAQNHHVARTLTIADRVTHRLMRMGLTVTQVHVGEAEPRIEVLPCEQCRQLERAISITTRDGDGQREQTKTARVDGALIEWREPA